MENPQPINPEYEAPGAEQDPHAVQRVEQVFGMFPTDDMQPTAPARKLDEQIRIVGGKVYVYDTEGNDWIPLASLERMAFSGEVAADGSAVSLPAGWSVSKTATGTYRVTHNFGTTAYSVVATPLFSSDTRMTAVVLSREANRFTINTLLTVSTDTDNPFFFVLMRQ